MSAILSTGLAIALGGPLLLVLASRRFIFDSLSLPSRLSLWLLAIAALMMAALGGGPWLPRLGVKAFGLFDLVSTLVAIIAMLVGAILLQLLLSRLGFKNAKGSELQQKVFAHSASYRFFIVVTAAVSEEVLYRGYAIGIGQEVWGSLAIAIAVSLFVFVAAHFTHGAKALASVFWISLIMSFLFVVTGNLFACILAHFAVDAFGVLYAPWITARHRARTALPVGEG